MFKSLPNSKHQTGMLYFFNFLCTIYKRFQEKIFICIREIVRERFRTFVSESIFKRLKFDYSFSETVSNKKIKSKNYFPDDCVFLEIRLTLESIITQHSEK